MKKVLTSSKLVRKVLSRSSNNSVNEESKDSKTETNTPDVKNEQDFAALQLELTGLKKQIGQLNMAVHNLQDEAEKKEKALVNIAREKQQLAIDLRKEKRSTSTLRQQLQDEREFYYKEKEQYCQEMNDCKKLKKKMSESIINVKKGIVTDESEEVKEYKSKISKLQEALNQTLEANYNLSVKFMRMKNTKSYLKTQLNQQESQHRQEIQNLQTAVNNLKTDLANIVGQKFNQSISPSNKKYLQVIKQNGKLIYENLCLRMEVDRLKTEIKDHKSLNSRRQENNKLKQVQSAPQQGSSKQKKKNESSTKRHTSDHAPTKNKPKPENRTQKPEDLTKTKKPTQQTANKRVKTTVNTNDTEVITIFERKSSSAENQTAAAINNNLPNVQEKRHNKNSTTKKSTPSISKTTSRTQDFKTASQMSSHVVSRNSGAISTATYSSSSSRTLRTRSAPEIFQSSSFVSKHKP